MLCLGCLGLGSPWPLARTQRIARMSTVAATARPWGMRQMGSAQIGAVFGRPSLSVPFLTQTHPARPAQCHQRRRQALCQALLPATALAALLMPALTCAQQMPFKSAWSPASADVLTQVRLQPRCLLQLRCLRPRLLQDSAIRMMDRLMAPHAATIATTIATAVTATPRQDACPKTLA